MYQAPFFEVIGNSKDTEVQDLLRYLINMGLGPQLWEAQPRRRNERDLGFVLKLIGDTYFMYVPITDLPDTENYDNCLCVITYPQGFKDPGNHYFRAGVGFFQRFYMLERDIDFYTTENERDYNVTITNERKNPSTRICMEDTFYKRQIAIKKDK